MKYSIGRPCIVNYTVPGPCIVNYTVPGCRINRAIPLGADEGKAAKDTVPHCAHEHPNEKVEPGESRQSPGRAPVYRHYAGTHRGYTGIRPRQSCGNAQSTGKVLPGKTGNDQLGTGNNRDCTISSRKGSSR
ncbi:hypothetical protein DPMN_172560 [Dreissena polymorpha]|uniref:Uncharacterized protein n=1 Tax=Dreissena polymorpha TaxID=45954 RepID=A0A9D4E1A4_DREPO|nr:hypothetical protein DPMN_172560 [Dreissena polymorpha]